jgi:membrane-associated phospholipid phosphatase
MPANKILHVWHIHCLHNDVVIKTSASQKNSMADLIKKIKKIDRTVNRNFPGRFISLPKKVDIFLEWLPLAYALFSGGKKTMTERIFVIAIAQVILNSMVEVLKDKVDRKRPGLSLKYNSFPSRHTAISFCGAEILYLQKDSEFYESAAGYFIAITTAALRLRRKKHWLSDVLAGAVIGIISAKLSRQLYNRFLIHSL